MANGVYQNYVRATNGAALPTATAEVVLAGTDTQAEIFTSRAGDEPLSNPFQVNEDGSFAVYAAEALYDVIFRFGAASYVARSIFFIADFTDLSPDLMAVCSNVLRDATGALRAGAVLTVLDSDSGEPRALYADREGDAPIENPITATDGTYTFYTAAGRIDIQFNHGDDEWFDNDIIVMNDAPTGGGPLSIPYLTPDFWTVESGRTIWFDVGTKWVITDQFETLLPITTGPQANWADGFRPDYISIDYNNTITLGGDTAENISASGQIVGNTYSFTGTFKPGAGTLSRSLIWGDNTKDLLLLGFNPSYEPAGGTLEISGIHLVTSAEDEACGKPVGTLGSLGNFADSNGSGSVTHAVNTSNNLLVIVFALRANTTDNTALSFGGVALTPLSTDGRWQLYTVDYVGGSGSKSMSQSGPGVTFYYATTFARGTVDTDAGYGLGNTAVQPDNDGFAGSVDLISAPLTCAASCRNSFGLAVIYSNNDFELDTPDWYLMVNGDGFKVYRSEIFYWTEKTITCTSAAATTYGAMAALRTAK